MLVLLLFNLVGYTLAFNFFQAQSHRALSQQVDNNDYDQEDLVEIKIPLNLPYMSTNTDFERIDGTVESGGVYYNYVKRKIDRDTLYMLCLKNERSTQLEKSKNDFRAGVHDFSTQKKNKESTTKSNPVSEYFDTKQIVPEFSNIHFSYASIKTAGTCLLVNAYIESLTHPPRA